MQLVGIAGSFRTASYNKALLKAARECLPAGSTLEILDFADLPIYNQDIESSAFPPSAAALKAKIRAADGIIIATPEYNRSIPGALKNMIDWTSRPYGDSAWNGKPVCVMGASGGAIGTAVAQSHLKGILLYLNCKVMGQPEAYIGGIGEKLNSEGAIADPATREFLTKVVAGFVSFAAH